MADIPVYESTAETVVVVTSNGQATFNFDFLVLFPEQMTVLHGRDDVETVLTYPADFSVSGLDEPNGGTVALNVATLANDVITMRRVTPIERLNDWQNEGDYKAALVNREQDTMFMIMQELARDTGETDAELRDLEGKAAVFPGGYGGSKTLPVPSPGKGIIGNASGTGFVPSEFSERVLVDASARAVEAEGRSLEGADRSEAARDIAEGARDTSVGASLSASGARDDAQAIANAIGPVKWYDTHALAVADLANIAADQVVGVFTDETQAGLRSLYRKEGSALVFKTVLDSDGLNAVNATRLGADPTGTKDSKAAFIAAAALAKAIGSDVITARPGVYLARGLTVDDIFGCYLVGDGIKFNNAWGQNLICGIYPFTLKEWANRGKATAATSNGRGMVAIELDDALSPHFTDVFPIFKEYGVTFGVVWPVHNDAIWIKEAHRHGFEIIAHGLVNETYGSMDPAEIHANAETMLDAVEGITGDRKNVAFVYPQHSRSETSDEILRRYFTRGRGLAADQTLSKDQGNRWLVTAYYMDGQHAGGGEISEGAKNWLRDIAKHDSKALIYLHYTGYQLTTYQRFIRNIIEYCQMLGITIARPSDVIGGTQLNDDPFFETGIGTTSVHKWQPTTTNTATLTASTDEAYWGTQSIKAEPGGTGLRRAAFWRGFERMRPAGKGFSLYRFKIRRKHGSYSVNAHLGMTFYAARWGIRSTDMWEVPYSFQELGAPLTKDLGFNPQSSTTVTIPATDGWEVFERIIAVDPSVSAFIPAVSNHIPEDAPPIYYDDFTIEFLGRVPTLHAKATLNGTNNVAIYTGIMRPDACGVIATPLAPTEGRVSIAYHTRGIFNLRSTSAADTAEVSIVFTPGMPFSDISAAVV